MPIDGPEPLNEYPVTLALYAMPGILSTYLFTSCITRRFSCKEVPGLVSMLIMTEPVSSSGISPFLVVCIRKTSNSIAIPIVPHINHLRLMKNNTKRM